MSERRKTPRSRTILGGVISFNKSRSTLDCNVRNFSQAGARVEFANTAMLPVEFDLTIPRKEATFRARTVWRSEDGAGVAFICKQDEQRHSARLGAQAQSGRDAEQDAPAAHLQAERRCNMTRVVEMLRSLRDSRAGSVPLQYAILAAGMAIVTIMTAQTAGNKVAEKLNAVTSALNKVQF